MPRITKAQIAARLTATQEELQSLRDGAVMGQEEYEDLCGSLDVRPSKCCQNYCANAVFNEIRCLKSDLAEANARLAGKWISVEERLPDDGAECLIVVPLINLQTKLERMDVFHGNYYAEEKSVTTCDGELFDDGEYTFWQPLPAPPVKGE